MRVHPSTMNIATVNAYAAAAENALAAQRAADVRKKLARSAASLESATDLVPHPGTAPGEAFLVSYWAATHPVQPSTEDEYHPSAKLSDLG